MEGIILRGIGSFYTVRSEPDGAEYTLRAQKKLRHQRLTPMVGDRVNFTPGEGDENGWIEAIQPRRSVMERPSVANADMLMLVVAPVPQADLMLIDKLIVRASCGNLIPAICVNKKDLGSSLYEQLQADYKETGLQLFCTSTVTGEGIDDLRETLRGKIVCLAGQSAVGKSSLINALLGLELETGGLSRKTERGRHTTRRCELLSGKGLYVLDTPGFSLLDLENNMDPEELPDHYPEYAALAGGCRFQPCLHDREPGCAVHQAVDKGELSRSRWERYRALLAEARENWKGRYQ